MNSSKLQIFLLFSTVLLTLSSSCTKDLRNPIPTIYLNFSINVKTDPEYLNLDYQNNAMIIKNDAIGATGYDNNGIIVYNAGDHDYYAFDCTCPYDYPQSTAVELTGSTAKCPKCGSIYVLSSSGTPTVNGPATLPLKEYQTIYNQNTGELTIHN